MLANKIMRREERGGERQRGDESPFQGNGEWTVLSFYMSLKDSTSNGRLSGIKQIPQMYSDDFNI